MKHKQAEVAQLMLRDHGFDIPLDLLAGVLASVRQERSIVYESGDFVEVYFGMGEMGHGTVRGLNPGGYRVELWSPDPVKYPHYTTGVGQGDMRGLSTVEAAQAYWDERMKTPT